MRHRLLAAALGLAALGTAPAAAAEEDPWELLRRLRSALEARGQVAEFTQEFLPAGFSSGERESGRLILDLPDCLRWDYRDPYPKSYLLCGDTIWTWNEGESSGRRLVVDEQEEHGLDLLRLSTERLVRRYRASLEPAGDARTVVLEPLSSEAAIRDARLTLGSGGTTLTALSYRDQEGNLTRFTLEQLTTLDRRQPLEPPAGLEWIEE